ncbi:hypothetical protein QN277_014180 [Acacia crassicarpa]|uniref:Uncharacterized protein n=1 Tax=Acacia crassicarpa TaxID=499986 RepID=A0AAE1N442_9FABA|nr:hypothetical protein QN277_014180 [Acacia crassicarpa]
MRKWEDPILSLYYFYCFPSFTPRKDGKRANSARTRQQQTQLTDTLSIKRQQSRLTYILFQLLSLSRQLNLAAFDAIINSSVPRLLCGSFILKPWKFTFRF